MLISTVCKTHGLSRIRGPILFLRFFSTYARVTHGFYDIIIDTPCRFEGLLDPRIGGDTHRSLDRFFDFHQRATTGRDLSRPTLRSRSAGRSLESFVSSDFHCVASGRAPVSLTMACVLNWSPCRGGTRRYTVYKYH